MIHQIAELLPVLRVSATILAAMIVTLTTSAHAQTTALGLWRDHTGRGVVEISDCGDKLCGTIVAVTPGNEAACGLQVMGGATAMEKGRWDGGWIYDPEREEKYDLQLLLVNENRLKVTGYEGIILFGESFIFTRADPSTPRCQRRGTS
jgi:uncharacterized protein (DUF2147 family)